MRQTPVHYLRANHAESTPRHVVFADTETAETVGDDRSVLALRCWVAQRVDRRETEPPASVSDERTGTTATELAQALTDWTRGRDSLWVYFHNLGFDVAATRLPMVMTALGWAVTDCAVGGKAPWLRFGRGRKVITVVDSWSWLPYALEKIAPAVGRQKVPLPGEADELAAWLHRCRTDTDALREAVCGLMDWWDRGKLGRWTITGAATGWNAYRHIPTGERVLVDPDPDQVRHDRRAVYGGRRGVWQVGELRAGPYLELDLVAAYPSVAASVPLPTRRAAWYPELPVTDKRLVSPILGASGRAVVRTDRPRYPVKAHGVTWYPVGTFPTHLAGPDVTDAVLRGELLELTDVWLHRLGMHMADWARWCLAVQNGEHPDSPDVARLACKAWGRSVIGKWSSRGFDKVKLGPSPVMEWAVSEGRDHETGGAGTMVDIAGARWWVRETDAGANSYPAVLAWVEASIRRRLSEALEAVGELAVVQCDTDGMIVRQRALGTRGGGGKLIAPDGLRGQARVAWCLERLNEQSAPLRWRVKRSHPHVTVLGPQHLVVGGTRRWSGFPSMAQLGEDGRYESRTWPGLAWQMTHGDPAGYVRPVVRQRPPTPLPTGWLLSDGRVLPPYAEAGPDGEARIVPWFRTPYAGQGHTLAANQHPELASRLW